MREKSNLLNMFVTDKQFEDFLNYLSEQLDNGKELGGEVHVEVAAGQEHLEITLKKKKREGR